MLRSIIVLFTAVALTAFGPAVAADLRVAVPTTIDQPNAEAVRHSALSNMLSLLLIRSTFDVLAIDDVETRMVTWGTGAPSDGERDELERQLLAEASYYIVSLRYLIEVGGAVFPADRPEAAYANDTLVKLDSLERTLAAKLGDHQEVAAILLEVEAIRALTEGYPDIPDELGVFTHHAEMLNRVWQRAIHGNPT